METKKKIAGLLKASGPRAKWLVLPFTEMEQSRQMHRWGRVSRRVMLSARGQRCRFPCDL